MRLRLLAGYRGRQGSISLGVVFAPMGCGVAEPAPVLEITFGELAVAIAEGGANVLPGLCLPQSVVGKMTPIGLLGLGP